jgi:hypothetical protein
MDLNQFTDCACCHRPVKTEATARIGDMRYCSNCFKLVGDELYKLQMAAKQNPSAPT